MSQSYDPYHLASPTVYLVKILIFLVLVALVAAILFNQLLIFFWANPFINSLIFLVLFVGIILSFRQIIRLFPEIRWVNALQDGQMPSFQPRLLAPVANLLRDRLGEAVITPSSMRSILDSVGNRLDEAKDTSRYLTGLLVFLGLLGTFYGLLETVTNVAGTIQALDATSGDTATLFTNLKEGLAAPLGGMGISFSSSLFGLAGSLILGFLDLQSSQAQNRFYTDLEYWLATTVREYAGDEIGGATSGVQHALDRLRHAVEEGSATRNATAAMANLAEAIQGLVAHMRTEQQMIREWADGQGEQNREIKKLLERIAKQPEKS